ncbi:MAG TPA: regulatory protein RecX [Thermodesulfovibrionales bacterium]|nr:regulatory protein RecX [Thermodesulfovibrionales bacterium]
MRADGSRRSALHYAYKLLHYRSRSQAEMERRLRMKGFDEPDIRSAMLILRENGFLDDRKLAASLTRYADESKHLSMFGARRFLIGRGIPPDLSDKAVKDIDDVETARRFVGKKMAGWEKCGRSQKPARPDDSKLRRLYGMLFRRGYPPEAIRKILEELKNKEDSQ